MNLLRRRNALSTHQVERSTRMIYPSPLSPSGPMTQDFYCEPDPPRPSHTLHMCLLLRVYIHQTSCYKNKIPTPGSPPLFVPRCVSGALCFHNVQAHVLSVNRSWWIRFTLEVWLPHIFVQSEMWPEGIRGLA